jgi:hypothetical protein
VVNEQPEEIAWEITAADIARRYKDVVGPSRVVVLAIDVKNAIESAVAAERQRQEAARAGLVEAAGAVVMCSSPLWKPGDTFSRYQHVGNSLIEGLRTALAAAAGTPSAPPEGGE